MLIPVRNSTDLVKVFTSRSLGFRVEVIQNYVIGNSGFWVRGLGFGVGLGVQNPYNADMGFKLN